MISQRYIGNYEDIGDTSKISTINEKKSLKFQTYIRYIDENLVKNYIIINKLILIIL